MHDCSCLQKSAGRPVQGKFPISSSKHKTGLFIRVLWLVQRFVEGQKFPSNWFSGRLFYKSMIVCTEQARAFRLKTRTWLYTFKVCRSKLQSMTKNKISQLYIKIITIFQKMFWETDTAGYNGSSTDKCQNKVLKLISVTIFFK